MTSSLSSGAMRMPDEPMGKPKIPLTVDGIKDGLHRLGSILDELAGRLSAVSRPAEVKDSARLRETANSEHGAALSEIRDTIESYIDAAHSLLARLDI